MKFRDVNDFQKANDQSESRLVSRYNRSLKADLENYLFDVFCGKQLQKYLRSSMINTLGNKILLFSVRQGSITTKNIASQDKANRYFALPEVNSSKIAVVLLSEKPTAQRKVKNLINFLIRLENCMCMGVLNITRWVSKAYSVISNVATRDVHNFVGISSGFLFNNKIKQGDI